MGLQGAERQTDRHREGRQRRGRDRHEGERENEVQRKEEEENQNRSEESPPTPSAFLELRVSFFLHEFNKLLMGASLPDFRLTHRAVEIGFVFFF